MPKAAKTAKTAAADPLVAEMDQFAKELLNLARCANNSGEPPGEPVSLQQKTDVFRQVGGWVAIKNRVLDTDPNGGALDDLRSRLRGTPGPPREGAARGRARGGDRFAASWANNGAHYPDGNGGPALEAVKRALPSSNASDDADASDDLEC